MAHHITSDCIGCGNSKKHCPTQAVQGSKKEIHHINKTLCIDCGTCGRVCPAGAVRNSKGIIVERIKKTSWLKPLISIDRCYACENCVEACPVNALMMKSSDLPLLENIAILIHPEKCISCGWCFDNCQFDAITMEVPRGDN